MKDKIKTFAGALIILIGVALAGELLWSGHSDEETEVPAPTENVSAEETEALPETESETETEVETEPETIELPEAYDLREQGGAPLVKNQGALETCWAVAASSALESSVLPRQHLVFSADHLSLQNPYQPGQDSGGAYSMIMAYLAAWMGPVLEADDPYGDGETVAGLEPVKHVQEMQVVVDKDLEAIKSLVYQHGAVQSSFYMDMPNSSYSSIYYNEFDAAYCYTGEEEQNHDVLIIGWDDHYPKENFTSNVERDGAFICQNSWGESFGLSGVFYVSYEDAWIGGYSMAYTKIGDTTNYDHLYQTDLCGWVGQLGYDQESCYFTNIYQSDGRQRVEAVGFYAVGKDTEYTIYKVDKYTRKMSLINREKLQSGTLKNPGYYTIPLKKPFEVAGGDRFAIVIEIKTTGENFPVAAEYQASEDTEIVTIEDGEGYISYTGLVWENTENQYECNVCLKVYSADVRYEGEE